MAVLEIRQQQHAFAALSPYLASGPGPCQFLHADMTAGTMHGSGRTKRVLVIGAGSRSDQSSASGLTAVRECLRLRQGFDVVAYEARSQVGGAWVYSSKTPGACKIAYDSYGRPFPVHSEESPAGVNRHANGATRSPSKSSAVLDPSPMYRLRTNIPANLMSYRGFPFTDVSGPFPRDDEVLKYLEDYSKEILPCIRFNTLVDRIRKDPKDKSARWIVTSTDIETSNQTTDEFDAICDCSGHYTRPYIPYVRNLWEYKRQILHAKWYRKPDPFSNQDVLVVGNSASGYDIGREIALYLKKHSPHRKVYQSIRHPFEIGIDPSEGPPWSSHLQTVAGLDHATEDDIVLVDGTRLQVDTVIFATGYLYSFPHCSEKDYPFSDYPLVKTPSIPADAQRPMELPGTAEYPEGGLQVHNLDADYQTFYYPDPTLAFLCLNKNVIPFPLAQAQAHAVAKRWTGVGFPLREPEETDTEDPRYHKYGFPKEFDVADALLQAVGEGNSDGDKEILEDGTFPATSRWRREERPGCKAFRQRELGY